MRALVIILATFFVAACRSVPAPPPVSSPKKVIPKAPILTETYQYYMKKAAQFTSKKKYVKAIENYTNAIAKYPDLPQPFYARGLAYLRRKKYKKSIADFNVTIDMLPNKPLGYLLRGEAYRKSGHFINAINDYDTAGKLDHFNQQAFVNQGRLWIKLQEYQFAQQILTHAVAVNPIDSNAYYLYAYADIKLGQPYYAEKSLYKALFLSPKAPHIIQLLAQCFQNQLKLEKALKVYNELVKLTPNSSSAYRHRALCHLLIGNSTQAFIDYERASKLKNSQLYNPNQIRE